MTYVPELGTLLLPFRKGVSMRVGVAIDRNPPQNWVLGLLEFLGQVPGVVVCPLLFSSSAAGPRPSWMAERLLRVGRDRWDPLARTGGEVEIGTGACDVLIWLAGSSSVDLRGLAKYGAFTVRLGQGPSAGIPYWQEVSRDEVTSLTTVYWHDETLSRGRLVRQAETSTFAGLSVNVNAMQPLTAAVRMLVSLCLEAGPEFVSRARRTPEEPVVAASGAYPSNFEAGSFTLRKLARSAALRMRHGANDPEWFVAIRPNRGQSLLDSSGFREIPLPAGVSQMADPFLFQKDGKTFLFLEEVAVGRNRGRLACAELGTDGAMGEMRIILDEPRHLSYPCIVDAGELLMLPETSETRSVEVHRFSRFPFELEKVSSLLTGAALVDSTPIFVDGLWYIFTTTGEPFMETFLFTAERLDGKWKLHPVNPISSCVKSARSAGQIFWRDGKLIRPAQDCSVRYGYAMTFREIVKISPREFEERTIGQILPDWLPGLLGTHTWNENEAFQVIDGLRYR